MILHVMLCITNMVKRLLRVGMRHPFSDIRLRSVYESIDLLRNEERIDMSQLQAAWSFTYAILKPPIDDILCPISQGRELFQRHSSDRGHTEGRRSMLWEECTQCADGSRKSRSQEGGANLSIDKPSPALRHKSVNLKRGFRFWLEKGFHFLVTR